MRRLGLALLAAGLLWLANGPPASAQDFPGFDSPVVDAANVIPVEVEQRVNAGLLDFQDRTAIQIAVAVVDTIGDASIENYTIDLAREWGVGLEDADNGVLLLIAVEDRQYRIEVGSGVEGDLTDSESGRIGREHLVPRLREGDYGAAVEVTTNELRRALGDDQVGAAPVPVTPAPGEEPGGGGAIVPFLIGGFFLLSMLGGIGGRRRRRRWGVGAPIVWGGGFGGGIGGGGFGGGGGGGFGGGGGGGFSGGGASGSW